MDFDHVRGGKLRDIARIVNSTNSVQVLAEELIKCDLVCSNCHRIRTQKRALKILDMR